MKVKMKDSGIEWIGEIPEDWKVVYLSSICSEHKRKNTGLVCKNLLSLSYGEIKRKDINTTDGLLPESFEGYNIIEKGDIVLRLTDLQNDQRSLRTGIAHETGLITSAYVTIRCLPNVACPYYIHYYLHSFDISKGFYGMGDGVRQGLNYAGIRKIMMLIPPMKTQQQIAAYLDKKCALVERLIENQRRQIEKLKEYKQSVITETVTKGLDHSVPMKDSGIEWIGKIPEDWKVKPLKYLFTFYKGLPITKADLLERGVKVINYGQIHAKYNKFVIIDDKMYRYVTEAFLESNSDSLVENGDFIFADTSEDIAGSGDFIYIDRSEIIFAGYHCVILKKINNLYNKYLAYLFMSNNWKQQLQSRVCGIKVFSISRTILSKTTVILPPFSIQQQIAAYLDKKCAEIDALIAIKQQKIEKLQEYKKSLIYEYVAGKKQVV